MNCCSVALHWENQLALMHLTIAGTSFGNICMYSLARWNGMNRGECWREEEGEIEIDEEQNGKQVSETMTQKRDKQAGRLRQSQPIDTALLMYLHISACVCACVYANVSGEIIPCGMLCPRSVGTSLGFHRYRSPGTRTDRQADGETVDHKQLSAEVLKPAHSQRATYWSLFPSFSTSTEYVPETPTWEDFLSELAMIGNSL